MRLKIRQLEELKVFNALRLSIEVLAIEVASELIAELAAATVAAEVVVTADIAAEAVINKLGYCSGGLDIN